MKSFSSFSSLRTPVVSEWNFMYPNGLKVNLYLPRGLRLNNYVPHWSQSQLEISLNPVVSELTFTCPHGLKEKFYVSQWPKSVILRAPVITH